ncbi:hypothetical protein ACFW88_33190 [Streptomyces anandii]|uniref:SAM-dependent methyltransferase n=1 Tax=Streptomyces anandii TaxID=285454 RepID=A0ABW6HFC4_9ACTN
MTALWTGLNAIRARSFNAATAEYAANRPYPPALLDAIEELSGRPLTGARVADVDPGTGIATTLLHARDADVLAASSRASSGGDIRRHLLGRERPSL